jgi:two-component system, NarL family, nitrate/nitrite response regulator NarL
MRPTKRANHKGKAKILIADGEGVFRLGLKKLFSVEDDLRVVAQAEDSLQLVTMARSFRPDLALVQKEIAQNGRPGVLEQIHKESPACKIIITSTQMTGTESEHLISEGASGVIPRSTRPEVFVENVRKVLGGEIVHLPQNGNGKGIVLTFAQSAPRPADTLTPREKTIISCLTQGLRNRDIANHLTITEQTVKNHLRSIYDKIGVSDRLELVLYAIYQRLELPSVNL